MPELCSIDFEDRGDCLIARVSGEIDISNSEIVGKRLATMFDTADHYVIDLSGTTHLDSAAIHLLFTLGERLRTRRQTLSLVVPRASPIRRILQVTDVAATTEVSADLDDVIARHRSDISDAGA
ncbi:MAG: STAS domain-containing protein [Acidimicrobiia bacterium]